MIYKRETKNKQEIRKKLIKYNYEIDYKDAVKKGLEIFNDKNVGEIWTREADFIITKCDFDWKVISSRNNSQTFCECTIFNINSTCYFRASIIINRKIDGIDVFEITDHFKRRIISIIADKDLENWKRGNRTHINRFNSFKCNVSCLLFDSEYQLKIEIPLPEKLINEILLGGIVSNGNFEGNEDYEVNEDYDWKRENFDALTDGQCGDYDDFDGDWDKLDDWRGA